MWGRADAGVWADGPELWHDVYLHRFSIRRKLSNYRQWSSHGDNRYEAWVVWKDEKYQILYAWHKVKPQTSHSTSSPPVPGPCAVQNVLAAIDCIANALSISWVPGSIPMNYSATAVPANGTALQCTTQGSSCTIGGLQCGQQYTVRVKPISSSCEGLSSAPAIVYSGVSLFSYQSHTQKMLFLSIFANFYFHNFSLVPCVPMNVQGIVDCSTNMLQASWDKVSGALSYISTLTGAGNFYTSCTSVSQSCSFSQLQCAQTYSLSVMALSDRCNGSKSAIVTTKTGNQVYRSLMST